jgi:hypothetical protein
MLKPTLVVFLALALLAAGCKKEGDDPRSAGAQPDKQADRDQRPSPPDRPAELTGDWRADWDGSELRIKRVADGYAGHFTKLSSELQSKHFAVGEHVMRGFKSTDGKTFKGELKWRSSDKREEWKPADITLAGDSFKITPGAPMQWDRIRPE